MSGFDEFMSKELIKKKCADCVTKSTCLAICDLLLNGKPDLAKLLLPPKK